MRTTDTANMDPTTSQEALQNLETTCLNLIAECEKGIEDFAACTGMALKVDKGSGLRWMK